jgi:hypothetical protein
LHGITEEQLRLINYARNLEIQLVGTTTDCLSIFTPNQILKKLKIEIEDKWFYINYTRNIDFYFNYID